MRADTIVAMSFSNVIQWFIVLTCASTLNVHGVTNIQTADQAAEALRPLTGDLTYALFAFGIIGIGTMAVPILSGLPPTPNPRYWAEKPASATPSVKRQPSTPLSLWRDFYALVVERDLDEQ